MSAPAGLRSLGGSAGAAGHRLRGGPSRRIRSLTVVSSGCLALALALVLALASAIPAQAHNVLLSTAPAAGSTVAALPNVVALHYDLPAQALGTAVVVRGPSGNVDDGPAQLVDTDVDQPIRPGSPPGTYTVAWRVVSADGHVVQGTFAFTARAPSTGTAAPLPSAIRAGTGAGSGPAVSAGWWVAGAAVLVVVAAGLVQLLRRRAPGDDDEDEGEEEDENGGLPRSPGPVGGSD